MVYILIIVDFDSKFSINNKKFWLKVYYISSVVLDIVLIQIFG